MDSAAEAVEVLSAVIHVGPVAVREVHAPVVIGALAVTVLVIFITNWSLVAVDIPLKVALDML